MPRSEGSQFSLLPEGERLFYVYEIGEEIKTEKSHYRVWKFNTMADGNIQQVWQNFFPFQEVPLLEAVGMKKDDKDGIDWEIDFVLRKRFLATVYHEKYKEKTYAKVKDFKKCSDDDQSIPF
jgi:hypothetical protein